MSAAKDMIALTLHPADRASLALLTDRDRGQLVMSLLDYLDGTDTSASLPPEAQMAFAFISARVTVEQDKYRRRCEVNRENATRRWSVRESTAPAADTEDG